MKLFIVRHGEKENDEIKSSLTDLGRQQAQKLSNVLKFALIKRIYSSSNLRSIQTAEIISRNIGIPLQIINLVAELPREMFFLPPSEWSAEHRMLMDNLKKFIAELKEKDEDVVVAMHAGINRAILSILLNLQLSETVHFTQDVACLNILEYKEIYGQKRWCVKLLNSTHHLE